MMSISWQAFVEAPSVIGYFGEAPLCDWLGV